MSKDILEEIFVLDKKVKLEKEEEDYLESIKEGLYKLIEEEGELGATKIKEVVLDDLIKYEYENLIEYLNLDIEEDIETTLKEKLEDDNFLKVEETEKDDDFFNNYLKDDIINDLIMSLLGYDRRSEGAKEVFIKKRPSKIPTKRVKAIEQILISRFNKTEFLSQKEDQEQAQLIMLTYSLIFDILLEIPYELCDTQKTIEILGMSVIKLSNSIGLSTGYRDQLMETMKASYQAKLQKREQQATVESD